MSGHSKWSTIKRKKGEADKKRGKIFTRCIHEITTAIREGKTGDPDANPRLRFAIDKAKASNMPSDTIDRAIRRATGEEKGEEKHELIYEAYGPGGAAIILEVLTENKNRTVGEIRHALTRAGGTLGETGCVGWMFKKLGVIHIPKGNLSDEAIMEVALEAGGDDVKDAGETWEVTSEPAQFDTLRVALEKKFKIESAEIQMVPSTSHELTGEKAEQMMRLLETLEDLDDVLNVYTNCEFAG